MSIFPRILNSFGCFQYVSHTVLSSKGQTHNLHAMFESSKFRAFGFPNLGLNNFWSRTTDCDGQTRDQQTIGQTLPFRLQWNYAVNA